MKKVYSKIVAKIRKIQNTKTEIKSILPIIGPIPLGFRDGSINLSSPNLPSKLVINKFLRKSVLTIRSGDPIKSKGKNEK